MILDQSAPPLVDKLSFSSSKNQIIRTPQPSNVSIFLGILPLMLSILLFLIAFFFLQSQIVIISVLPVIVGGASLGTYLLIKTHLDEQNQTISQIADQQKTLSASNTQLEAILQSIQEGMIITNLQGQISLANKNASQILQREQSTLQNQPIEKILFIEDLRGKIIKDYEANLQSPTNTKIVIKISSFPLVSGGLINGTIYIITDITQESELAKMKLDFVAQAAHQLRTPLTILKSYLSVLQEKIGTRLGEEDKLYLDRSVIGANQLADLIENLLNVSKIEQNKLELQLTPTQIDQLIAQVIQQLQPDAANKKITIRFQPTELPPILADQHLISQVLLNLIKNGIEYSHSGGEVVIVAVHQNQDITVTISDNGMGIPSEAAANLFTKFFKVTGDLRQESKGIGLGLYNAKSIIEAHHGKIWVNSILGKGSSFGFSLPVNFTALN